MLNKLKKLITIFLAAAALLLAGCGAVSAVQTSSSLPHITAIDNELSEDSDITKQEIAATDDIPEEPEEEPQEEMDSEAAETQTTVLQEALPQESIEPQSPVPAQKAPLLACNFYDELMFNGHLAGSKKAAELLDMQKGLKAAIIPHHLTAGDYITAVFEQAATEEFETVVFLAPNHTGQGGDVVYSLSDWQTAFGELRCDKELTEYLMRDKQIMGSINDARMQADHSISGLIPYMTYFMPETKVVNILLSGNIDLAKVRRLAEMLAESEKKILLICSVDFSHYLQFNEAAEKDKETISAIESANFSAIADFNNDHFDSAPCVTAFLSYAQELELTQKLHWQGTSSELVGYGPEKYIEGGITTYQIWMLNE